MSDELNHLAVTYLRYYREKTDEDWWAWEEVDKICSGESHKAFELVLLLLSVASDKKEIAFIAAGPLENLLDRAGKAIILKFKEEIRLNRQPGSMIRLWKYFGHLDYSLVCSLLLITWLAADRLVYLIKK